MYTALLAGMRLSKSNYSKTCDFTKKLRIYSKEKNLTHNFDLKEKNKQRY